MRVTADLMKACGSGADPNDLYCVAGFNFFVSALEKYHPDTMAFPTLKETIATMRSIAKEENVPRETALHYIKFLAGLRKNPKAIFLGGYAKQTGEYRFDHPDIGYLHGTREHLEEKRQSYLSSLRPYTLVNVLKHLEVPEGTKSICVQSSDLIVEGFSYSVFQSGTGRHRTGLSPNEVDPAVMSEFNYLRDRLSLKTRLMQKVVDTDEGYSAWAIM